MVGKGPGRVADDEHEGDGDAGASDPDLTLPDYVRRVALACAHHEAGSAKMEIDINRYDKFPAKV